MGSDFRIYGGGGVSLVTELVMICGLWAGTDRIMVYGSVKIIETTD